MASVLALPTPNPNALKFSLSGAQVIPEGMRSYSTKGEATGDALGEALFTVQGVENVFWFLTSPPSPSTPPPTGT